MYVCMYVIQYGATASESLGVEKVAFQLLKDAKVEHTNVIQKLMNQNVINLTSENIFLAAFDFAFKCGSVELAERMLWNQSYSKIDKLYPDAMCYSAKNNWPTILSKLLDKEVNVNALTDGQTPLYAACKEEHETVVSLLLNNGADPNMEKRTYCHSLKGFLISCPGICSAWQFGDF